MAETKMRLWLFKNDKKSSDRAPDKSGGGEVDKASLLKMVEAMKASEDGVIKLDCAGWNEESKAGKRYISINVSVAGDYSRSNTGSNEPAVKEEDVPW